MERQFRAINGKKKIIHYWGRCMCHRRPDRSFFFKEHQFPVCARCTGVFVGQIVAILTSFFLRPSIILCIDFCMIIFIDWLVQYLKIKESTNFRRLITGLLGGFGLMSIEIEILIKLWNWLVRSVG